MMLAKRLAIRGPLGPSTLVALLLVAVCHRSSTAQDATILHFDDHSEVATAAFQDDVNEEDDSTLTSRRDSTAAEEDDELGDLDALLDADITQLSHAQIAPPETFGEEVTTVSRQESTVGRSPAAIYVITGNMIRRSGARSLPEALRLAPGVEVARIDANKWSISIRGFNQRFANKLLIQIDGRTVYTPLFAGVFWDVQDVLMEDVDRIEVIRGPGASVWGANAVNGVINVITKRSQETTGVFAEAGGGDERGFGSARVGGNIGRTGSWRAYGKWFEREQAFSPTGAADDWGLARGGFRSDWSPSCVDNVTLQGDYYDGRAGKYFFAPLPSFPFVSSGPGDDEITGGNVLFRWSRELSDDSDWSLQVFYDRTERLSPYNGFREDRDTVDVDFQHRFRLGSYQSVIWGAGYRNTRDRIRNAFSTRFLPPQRADDRFSTFVQDELTLLSDLLFFTAGSKFSWNDYTGFEYQPTLRMLYTPSKRQSIWASVSRAVRVPSRASDDVRSLSVPINTGVFPTYPTVIGDRNVLSEQLLAWELGMRAAPSEEFFWDLALFYNRYDDLHTLRAGFPGIDPITGLFSAPLTFFNGVDAESYGFELATTMQLLDNWSLRGGYNFLRLDLHPSPLAFAGATASEGESPRNRFFLHSSWDPTDSLECDLIGRYSDNLAAIPSYFELDARVAWNPTDRLEFAVVGRNLLDKAHPEFSSDNFSGVLATEVQREVYGQITWRR